MSALLRLEAVTLDRGGRRLFEHLDLTVAPGEAVAVTGPNGSGKSSLLRLAAGLLAQTAGEIERSALALADDRHALDRERPLADALSFWCGRDPLPALDKLGIGHLAAVPVRYLSSGQAKRASLARVAAASGAALWLLDEPTNALDVDGIERLTALIAEHRASGGAVLAATHVPLSGDWRRLELRR